MRRRKIHFVIILVELATLACLIVISLSSLIAADILNNNLWKLPDDMPPSFCETMDTEMPEIVLNGSPIYNILLGKTYDDPGVTATDDCGVTDTQVTGIVDTTTVGSYMVDYSVKDASGNVAEAKRVVKVWPEYKGTIYLTFDDGPGPYTSKLLDVLKKYDVKATFFVTGAGDDELIKREYDEGHAIGLHTYSHDYAQIYQNVDMFFEDLYLVQERVKNITGYVSDLMRFPGGSSNTVSRRYDGGVHIMSKLVVEVKQRGFTYFDWNIMSGDAGDTTETDSIFDNVVNALREGGDSVVLQHDIKDFSVAAVERIIKYGLENGYVFAKLDKNSYNAHHRINN